MKHNQPVLICCVCVCLALHAMRCDAAVAAEGLSDAEQKKAYESAMKVAQELRKWHDGYKGIDIRTPAGKKAWDTYSNKRRAFRRRLLLIGAPALTAVEKVGLAGKSPCAKPHYWSTYVLLCGKDIPAPGRQRLVSFFRKQPLPLADMAQMLEDLKRHGTSPDSWMPLEAIEPLVSKLLASRAKMWQLCMSSPGWPEVQFQGPDGKVHTAPGNPGEDHVINMRGCDVAVRYLQTCYGAKLGWDFRNTKEAAAARDAAVAEATKWVAERMTRFRVKEALYLLLEKRRELKVDDKDRLAEACRLAASFTDNRGDVWRLVRIWLAEVDELESAGAKPDDLTKAFLRSLTAEVAVLFKKYGAGKRNPPRGRSIIEAERARAWITEAIKVCQKSEKSWHDRNEWEILRQRVDRRSGKTKAQVTTH